jgi:hypothetical protein
MAYLLALAGFALFFALGAIGTASSFLFSSLRRLRPYAWRAWLWGSIGFLVVNVLFFAIIAYPLTHMGIAGSRAGSTNIPDIIFGAAVAFGPLLASTFGVVVGVFAGCYFARRKLAAQSGSDARQSMA